MMAAAPGAYLEKVALFQQRFEATIADHQSKQTTSLNQKQVNPVEVHVRQRPRNAREEKDVKLFQTCFTSCNETILYYPSFQVLTDPAVDVHKFEFDGNHGVNTGQNSFYLAACKDLWSTVESGGIFTLFAYGQTGSGKTHTVMGVCNNMVNELPFITHDISIQLLEVIGDVVRCLNTQKSLRVLIDPKGTPVLQGDSKFINVRTIEDAKIAIDLGFKSRKTVGTFKNDTSSRSHFICRILMTHKSTNIVSEVKLVDLAGSERNSDSANHSSERVKESVYINKSLMSLKSCIRQRSSTAKTAERVPCRASKLTLLLKDVLDPSHSRPVKLVMVATLSPTIAGICAS